ncbi:MAG: hypothetical protein EZS28_032773 [Streblomastix strix]|uniref:Uncharacterized protein n=1 Tax=Streblomastix strix TaxID=222440 RepID=A0A5J4UNY6_9EUKA|nr:MAG: hypothetical protein EZS28_032773 [Streblomastix strix]
MIIAVKLTLPIIIPTIYRILGYSFFLCGDYSENDTLPSSARSKGEDFRRTALFLSIIVLFDFVLNIFFCPVFREICKVKFVQDQAILKDKNTIVAPILSEQEQASDLLTVHFQKLSINSVKLVSSEQGLFMNFNTPMITARTPVTTTVEQPELVDQIGKFLQSEQQSTLKNIERQLTTRQTVSERTQILLTKVLEAMSSLQTSEINFRTTNIFDQQNGEARRREIQCPSQLPITSVPVLDEVLDSKLCPIDKILQRGQALSLYNFRIGEGILAQCMRTATRKFSNRCTQFVDPKLKGSRNNAFRKIA